LRIEQNLPARSRKMGEAPIPRVGKRLPGFGIERAPSREGVSALDHRAKPAASLHPYCLSTYNGFPVHSRVKGRNAADLTKEKLLTFFSLEDAQKA
jgi:hypothetical protein